MKINNIQKTFRVYIFFIVYLKYAFALITSNEHLFFQFIEKKDTSKQSLNISRSKISRIFSIFFHLQMVAANGCCKGFCSKCRIFAANDCCKWLLQMILLQMSYFCCKWLLQMAAANGFAANDLFWLLQMTAANGFAANDRNLGGPEKPGCCK